MRKIKFRAWDELKNQMFRVLSLHLYVARPLEVYLINESGDGWIRNANSVKLMQSTGLKDKNGVEIYEGDIFIHKNNHKFVVKWDEDRFIGLDYKRNGNGYCCCIGSCDKSGNSTIEVIGNIYETPELLGGQNE